MSLKISSRPAAARIGPEPIAKKPAVLICHPAYWAARQARTGSSDAPWTSGPSGPACREMSASPAVQTRDICRPAWRPPTTAPPQSMTRAPPTWETAQRHAAAFAASTSAQRMADSLSVMARLQSSRVAPRRDRRSRSDRSTSYLPPLEQLPPEHRVAVRERPRAGVPPQAAGEHLQLDVQLVRVLHDQGLRDDRRPRGRPLRLGQRGDQDVFQQPQQLGAHAPLGAGRVA